MVYLIAPESSNRLNGPSLLAASLATPAQFLLAFSVMALVAIVLSAHAICTTVSEALQRRADHRRTHRHMRRALTLVGAVSL